MQLSTKVGYGVGQVSDGVKQSVFSLFLFFFYNQLLGLPASLAGLAALLALMVDAITDPMVGQYSDQLKSKWGRRHPFMFVGSLLFGSTLLFLFMPPADLTQFGLFGWMLCWSVIARVMLTFFYVPHLSLGSEMVKGYHERTNLISYRVFFSYLGGLITSLVGFVVFFAPTEEFANGMLNAENYPKFAAFACVFAMITMFYSVFATRKTIPQLRAPAVNKNAKHPLIAFITIFKTLKQKSFRMLFLTILAYMALTGVGLTLLVYVATYLFGFDSKQLAMLIFAQFIGLMFAPLAAKKLSARFDKRKALSICVVVGVLITFLPINLYLSGHIQQMSVEARFMTVFLLNGLSQVFLMAYVIVFDSMLSDTIDEHELETGLREEGLYFATRSFAFKASYGLGAFIAGIGLDVIKFPKGLAPDQVPQDTLMSLAMFSGPFLMVAFLLTIFIAKKYTIDEARHEEIVKELHDKGLRHDEASASA